MSLKMLSLDGKVIAEIKTLIEGLSKVFGELFAESYFHLFSVEIFSCK